MMTEVDEGRIEAAVERLLAPVVETLKKRVGLPAQEWYSPAGIASIFGMKKRAVLDAIKSGELPAANIGRGEQPKYNIYIEDANAWMRGKMSRRTGDTKNGRQELVSRYFGSKKQKSKTN